MLNTVSIPLKPTELTFLSLSVKNPEHGSTHKLRHGIHPTIAKRLPKTPYHPS